MQGEVVVGFAVLVHGILRGVRDTETGCGCVPTCEEVVTRFAVFHSGALRGQNAKQYTAQEPNGW